MEEKKSRKNDWTTFRIDASRILPSDRSYYTFSGSLTTPPCSEDVTWFVLKHPTTISAEQIEQFSQLYHGPLSRCTTGLCWKSSKGIDHVCHQHWQRKRIPARRRASQGPEFPSRSAGLLFGSRRAGF